MATGIALADDVVEGALATTLQNFHSQASGTVANAMEAPSVIEPVAQEEGQLLVVGEQLVEEPGSSLLSEHVAMQETEASPFAAVEEPPVLMAVDQVEEEPATAVNVQEEAAQDLSLAEAVAAEEDPVVITESVAEEPVMVAEKSKTELSEKTIAALQEALEHTIAQKAAFVKILEQLEAEAAQSREIVKVAEMENSEIEIGTQSAPAGASQ